MRTKILTTIHSLLYSNVIADTSRWGAGGLGGDGGTYARSTRCANQTNPNHIALNCTAGVFLHQVKATFLAGGSPPAPS